MKNYYQLSLTAFVALTVLAGTPARADNMASIGITPATGVVTLSPQWSIGSGLAGFHHMSQDLGLGGQANNFYSLTSANIPLGGNTSAFKLYVAASGFATSHADIGSKLTPYSYSALTSADPDVGYGSVNMYFIHHKSTGDYFSVLVPGSAVSSSVTDLKPMDGPGGPATLGTSGYFGLTFASGNLGYGLNQFYYLRTHAVTGHTIFGTLSPGLLSTSADQFSLGTGGHDALAFTGVDVGYGTNKMYYLREDPITGYTILGTLNPDVAGVRHTADIANLGSVFTTLTFTASDLGFGVNKFYTTGSINPTWQSVSFAAIADRSVNQGSFTVNPTASSALPITLSLVTGSATISSPVGGVFTITPMAPGLITLQATQVGATNPTAYEYNMLRQGFLAAGGAPDFNNDGHTDILWRNSASGEIGVWLMNATGVTSYASIGSVGPGWSITGTGDFNGDARPDILWRNDSTGEVGVWLMNGTTVTGYTSIGGVGLGWSITGTGDFNHDGKTDILWSNLASGDTGAWLMNGTAVTGYTYFETLPANWIVSGTGDFNGDGHMDILWRNAGTGEIRIKLFNGTAVTGYVNVGAVGLTWTIQCADDFNGDGKTDILWRNAGTGEIGVWLMNGVVSTGYIRIGSVSGTDWSIEN